ncbi:M28 family metallopeptidase [Gynuella sp.]|uniref:M28 family metallopeptidase n=1 Tax=Gynuella sp. TaxID=2969146 RepID=UPI003D0FB967
MQSKILQVAGVLLTGSLLLSTQAMAGGSHQQRFSTFIDKYWSDNDLPPWQCRFIPMASPLFLPHCMQADNVTYHLQQLQNIADANDGTRAAGLPGYSSSVSYITDTLSAVGYDVTLSPFDFNAFYENADGALSSLAPEAIEYVWDEDFGYLSQTEPGDVSGPVVAVDLELGEGNASTSGCETEDFEGFEPGAIALVQRGSCTFQQKAENAAAAGAIGAIIFNQGDSDDRTGLISATLGADYSGGIPVFFATYDNGVTWSETEDLELRMVADVLREMRSVNNVIAESRWGNDENVVMLGAHLDSVFEGPGINDNGSGSAGILEMALLLKNARTKNKIRYAWWGAEEAGLVGSTQYVLGLEPEELAKIKVYLNFDMIGSPNAYYGIYDGDGSTFELEGPPGSAATEALFEQYFDIRGLPFEGSEISFRSDYAQFFEEGIAFGGLFTGAEEIKTDEQAVRYGGEAGLAFDACYHRFCDDITNLDQRALEINADAIAYVTAVLANSTSAIDEEIDDSELPDLNAQSLMRKSSVSYDKSHWGKYWIK